MQAARFSLVLTVILGLWLPTQSRNLVQFGEEELKFEGASDEGRHKGQHWALVVAGSSGWFNYRHQADACHAYQILKKHGIPDERIVVMMADDIAHSRENPTPGVIINRPNGTDVYHGVPKDYTGEDVTPENFLNILQGNQEAMQGVGSGKVIQSGPDDLVFVNFADHGAPGLIAFPDGELHARPLNDAIKSMASAGKFKQMVIYVEACESGSMFKNLLPEDINVYATTAANSKESSYACYFDKKRHTYLGDVYSIKWMEDSDKENLNKETLAKQFKIVRKETNTSHVQEFGDLSIAKEHVGVFQGSEPAPPQPELSPVPLDAVPSEDVELSILHHKLKESRDIEEQAKLVQEIKAIEWIRTHIAETMEKIALVATSSATQASRVLTARHELRDYDCYEPLVEHFKNKCFNFHVHEIALRHLYKLVNLCEERIPAKTIMAAMDKSCF